MSTLGFFIPALRRMAVVMSREGDIWPSSIVPCPSHPHFFHSHPLTRASKSLSFPLLSCTISCWDQSTLLTFDVRLLRCNYQNEQCCITLSHLFDCGSSSVSRPQWWSTPVTTICELPCTGAFSTAHRTHGLKQAENIRKTILGNHKGKSHGSFKGNYLLSQDSKTIWKIFT